MPCPDIFDQVPGNNTILVVYSHIGNHGMPCPDIFDQVPGNNTILVVYSHIGNHGMPCPDMFDQAQSSCLIEVCSVSHIYSE